MFKLSFNSIVILLFILSKDLYALAPMPPPKGYYKCDIEYLTKEDITPELVASSEYIVEDSLIVPEKQIKQVLVSEKHKYVLSSLIHVNAIKGNIRDKKITISHFAREQKHNVCIKTLVSHNQQKVLAFLVKPDEFKEGHYFFHNKYSLMLLSKEKLASVKKITKIQKKILKEFDSSILVEELESKYLHKKVKNLIDLTITKSQQQSAFDQLFKLGKAAVPSIILQMEDYRNLPNSVTYSPFMHHYGPDKVIDGLSTILSSITGKFGSRIANGGSSRERKHIIDLWRLYLVGFNEKI